MHSFLSTLILFCLCLTANAQETLILSNGREVAAKVLEVGSQEIRYKRSDLPEGPDYRLYRRDVQFIKYANGVIDTLSKGRTELVNQPAQTEVVVSSVPATDAGAPPVVYASAPAATSNAGSAQRPREGSPFDDSFDQAEPNYITGMNDALVHYKGYKGAGTGVLLGTFVGGIILGLIPAIACASSPPKERTLGVMNPELYRNPAYQAGYNEQARKIKSRKVWSNYGIGAGLTVALFAIIAASR